MGGPGAAPDSKAACDKAGGTWILDLQDQGVDTYTVVVLGDPDGPNQHSEFFADRDKFISESKGQLNPNGARIISFNYP